MVGIDEFRAGFSAHEAGYLNYAAVGPLSEVARSEELALMEVLGRARFGAIDQARGDVGRAREAIAELTGFDAAHVVDQPNTSTALMHVMFALSGGVMVSRREFPALPYATQRAHEALGRLQPLWLDPADGRLTPELVRDNLSVDVDAVAVSLVDYRTGYVADLSGIRDVIGDRLLIVDVIQGLGIVDADYAAADVVAGGGHKWLRAGRGTGFLAFSDFALDRMRPVMSGLYGSADPQNWDEVLEPAPGADAYRISLPDVVGQVRLAAALEEIAAVGVPAIAAAVAERAERVLEIADGAGIPVTSPRESDQRAGIIMLNPGAENVGALGAALHNAGVSVTVRGGGVRVSVHAGTTDATLDLLRGALGEYATATAGQSAAQVAAAAPADALADGFIVLGAQVVAAEPVADEGAGGGADAGVASGAGTGVASGAGAASGAGDTGPVLGDTVSVTPEITLPAVTESDVLDETAPVTIVTPAEGGLEPLDPEALEPRAAADVRKSGEAATFEDADAEEPAESESAQSGDAHDAADSDGETPGDSDGDGAFDGDGDGDGAADTAGLSGAAEGADPDGAGPDGARPDGADPDGADPDDEGELIAEADGARAAGGDAGDVLIAEIIEVDGDDPDGALDADTTNGDAGNAATSASGAPVDAGTLTSRAVPGTGTAAEAGTDDADGAPSAR